MRTCFMHGFLLLPAHNNVLLSRQELMVSWMLLADHFVIQVKVIILLFVLVYFTANLQLWLLA